MTKYKSMTQPLYEPATHWRSCWTSCSWFQFATIPGTWPMPTTPTATDGTKPSTAHTYTHISHCWYSTTTITTSFELRLISFSLKLLIQNLLQVLQFDTAEMHTTGESWLPSWTSGVTDLKFRFVQMLSWHYMLTAHWVQPLLHPPSAAAAAAASIHKWWRWSSLHFLSHHQQVSGQSSIYLSVFMLAFLRIPRWMSDYLLSQVLQSPSPVSYCMVVHLTEYCTPSSYLFDGDDLTLQFKLNTAAVECIHKQLLQQDHVHIVWKDRQTHATEKPISTTTVGMGTKWQIWYCRV